MNDPADARRRSIDADFDFLLTRFQPRGRTMRNHWDPDSTLSGWRMGPPATNSRLRVSDAERNEMADKLSSHFAEGRLDQAEFKERLDTAMSAKTRGDLSGLFDDLPPLTTGTPAPAPHPRRRRLVPLVVLAAILAVAASSTFPTDRWFHVPWLLIAVLGILLWRRVVRHRRHVG